MVTSTVAPRATPLRRSTRALTIRITALAAAAALVLSAGLSWRMTRGGDPALGPKAAASVQTARPSKRIVKTVVIKRVKTAARTQATPATISSAPVAPTTVAPVATSTS